MCSTHAYWSLLLIFAIGSPAWSDNYKDDTSCPTWQVSDSSSCSCGSNLNGRVICMNGRPNEQSYLLYCNCMSYDSMNKSIVGSCIYNCFRTKRRDDYKGNRHPNDTYLMNKVGLYYPLPQEKEDLNETCSHFHRTGLFCGDCMANHSPIVFSYRLECIKCNGTLTTTLLKLFLYIILPQTVFYFMVVMFMLSVTSPKFTAFLLVSQVLGSPQLLKEAMYLIPMTNLKGAWKNMAAIFIQFYSTWNLDFFRIYITSTCFSNMDTHTALMLELIPALYPLLLAIVTITLSELHARGNKVVVLLWSPFRMLFSKFKKNWNIDNSIMDVLATLLYLSFMKIGATVLDLMTLVLLRDTNGNIVDIRHYYQPSSNKFIFTGIALLFFLMFAAIPILFILLYPVRSFRTRVLPKILCNSVRATLAMKVFMDSLQGYYKDGTDPRYRDYRYMAGLYMLLRLVIYLEFMVTLYDNFMPCLVVTVTVFAFFILLVRPYKHAYRLYNVLDPLMLGNLAFSFSVFSIGEAYRHEREMQTIYRIFGVFSISMPALYFLVVMAISTFTSKLSLLCLRKVRQVAERLWRKGRPHRWEENRPLLEEESLNYAESRYDDRTI